MVVVVRMMPPCDGLHPGEVVWNSARVQQQQRMDVQAGAMGLLPEAEDQQQQQQRLDAPCSDAAAPQVAR